MLISNYEPLDIEQNSLFKQRFEKEKYFQKKRRLKKQKLETRRRKKRKRFFPRPVWLRFHLYKKFLKVRHSKKSIKQQPLFLQAKTKFKPSVLQKQNLGIQFKTQPFFSDYYATFYSRAKKISMNSFFMFPSKNFIFGPFQFYSNKYEKVQKILILRTNIKLKIVLFQKIYPKYQNFNF